jgi:hypothetical protein
MKPRIVISQSSTRKHGFWTEEVVYKFYLNGKLRSFTKHERIIKSVADLIYNDRILSLTH